MRSFLFKLGKFLGAFGLTFTILLLIDLYVYDKVNNNPYLTEIVNTRELGDVVFIGSSKFYYHHVDSLMSFNVSFLSSGGQFYNAVITVLLKLNNMGLLNEKTLFIDLQDNNENDTGFGDWWYYSESFIENRSASIFDYSLIEQVKVFNRIIVDILDFGKNKSGTYKWIPYESEPNRKTRNFDEKKLVANIQDYNEPSIKGYYSTQFLSTMKRLEGNLERIESMNNCKIYVIVPPAPKQGSINQLRGVFKEDRLINMTDIIDDPKYFQDLYHLNAEGAVLFTMELNRLIFEKVRTEK